MSTLSEISVAVPQLPPDDVVPAGATFGPWAPVELSPTRRPSPTTLVVLALLAGIGALTLGLLAGVTSLGGGASSASVDRQVLGLLAKPSTERIAFTGSGGRLVLAVGSGGRAAISMRALEPAATGAPYYAWVLGTRGPVKAATFDGTERAVLLTVPVGPNESVVVSHARPTGAAATSSQFVAVRG